MTCPETIAIGAYVLGALDTEERLATERHLRDCLACRETLLQFAHLPGLLHTVALEDIVADEPEPAPLQLSRPPVRRRRSWTLIAAVVILVGAMTGVIGWRALGNGPASVTWSATDGELDTTAEMTSRAWGTAIQLRMTDLDPGEHCKLVVHSTDGFTETTGWWATTGVHEAQVPASTSIPLADISRIEVVTATGRVLSTLTPSSR